MQKRNSFLKIVLIAIIAITFLLIMQGKVMANDESWEGKTDGLGGLNWWQDKVGEVYTGENYGIKWEAKITQTNDAGGQVGRVSFKVTNPEEISGEIELPNYIKGKGFLVGTYLYEIEIIEEGAFNNADKITKVTLGEYVKNIRNEAFVNCDLLKEIVINKNLISTGFNMTVDCFELDKITVHQENKYLCSDEQGILYNKDKTILQEYPDGKKIEEYTIPNTVRVINDMAFCNKNIKILNIPESVEKLGVQSVSCYNLEKVNFLGNSKLKEIRLAAFWGCVSLKTINIPDSVELIKEAAFGCCWSLEEIKLPKNLKVIERIAFYDTGLKNIEIPKNTSEIGERAFAECSNLKTVVLSNNISTMGASAFDLCNSDLVVYCYDCDDSFINNINANSTIIPAYILCDGIDDNPQDNTVDYVRINKFVEGPCRNIELLSHVYGLPVKVLGEAAFKGNNNIQKIKIPTTVTTMQDEVFCGCTSLNNVVLPKTIENIPSRAFYKCDSLSKVVIKKGSAITSIGEYPFEGASSNLIVYHDGENSVLNSYGENLSTFRIDNKAPSAEVGIKTSEDKLTTTIELNEIQDNNGGSEAEFYAISLSDTVEGVQDSEWQVIPSSKIEKTVDENGTWHIYLMDMVGNVKNTRVVASEIDETAPVVVGEPTIEYSINGAKITVTVEDETNGSGLKGYAITNSSNVEDVSKWNELSGLVAEIQEIVTTNGTWYLYVKDKSDNILKSEIRVTEIDDINPEVGTIIKSYKELYATVIIDVFDNQILDAYAIDLNENISNSTEWINIDGDLSEYTINYNIIANGTYYVHVKDKYGNVNDSAKSFKIEGLKDGYAPRIEFVEKTNNVIKVKITDEFSGIASGAKISFAWNESSDSQPEDFKQIEISYENGAKEAIFEVPCEGQGTKFLWLNIEELKDLEGNVNNEGKVCSDAYTFDVVAPTITNVTANKSIVKNGDIVILTITTSENVFKSENIAPAIEESNQAQALVGEITGEGTTWELTVTAGAGNGPITVAIPKEMFKDEVSNTLVEDYKITDLITIDNTAPNLPQDRVTISDAIISKDQEATFTFSTEEEINLVESKINEITLTDGEIVGVIKEVISEDGKTWNITVIGGEGNGEVKLKLPTGLFVDNVGNEISEMVYDGLKFDNAAPTIEIMDSNSTIVNSQDTVMFTVKSNEPVQINEGEIELKNVNDGETITGTVTISKKDTEGKEWEVTITNITGNGEAKLLIPAAYFIDEAGNTSTVTEKTGLKVDNIVPVIGEVKNPALNGNTGKVEVEIEIPETEEKLEYVVSKSETIEGITEEWKEITEKPLKVEIEEPGTYYVYIKDEAGNITRTEAIVIPETIFDIEAPTITIDIPNSLVIKEGQTAIYKVTTSEEVKQIEGKNVTLSGTGSQGSTVEITGSATNWEIKITAGNKDGEITVTIPEGYFEDEAGNKNAAVEKTGLKVDNIAPAVGTIKDPVLNGNTGNAEVEIEIPETEEKLQYVVSKSETIEGITEEWKEITTKPLKIEVKEPGTYYVYIKDEAGNITRTDAIVIPETIFDVEAPTVTIEGPNTSKIKAGQTAIYKVTSSEEVKQVEGKTVTLSGAGSEGSTVEITGSGINWEVKVTAGQTNGEVSLVIPRGYFIDLANNEMEAEVTRTGLTVDNIAPVIGDIKDPEINGNTGNAEVEIEIPEAEEKLQYVVSKSETIEGITEEWKEITTKPLKIEIKEPGIYYVYIKDEAGNITKSDKIEIPAIMFDKTAPNLEVEYKTVEGQMKVIIKANEEIQLVEGWNYTSENKLEIEKVITEDTSNTIEVKDLAGNTSEIAINVKLVTEISLDIQSLTLEKDKTQKLVVTVNPDDATDKEIIWESSNTNVATVDSNGNVIAKAPGYAEITATTKQGNKKAVCTVTVPEEKLVVKLKMESTYEMTEEGENLYIENIAPKTTIETVMDNIETNGTIRVYQGETEITDKAAIIGTGMTVKVSKGTEEREYKIVVIGDLNGDGQMNDIDLLMLARYKVKLYNGLTGAYLRASDVVKNGTYADDMDLLKMARVLVGLDNI